MERTRGRRNGRAPSPTSAAEVVASVAPDGEDGNGDSDDGRQVVASVVRVDTDEDNDCADDGDVAAGDFQFGVGVGRDRSVPSRGRVHNLMGVGGGDTFSVVVDVQVPNRERSPRADQLDQAQMRLVAKAYRVKYSL